jgi:hypothetical protein
VDEVQITKPSPFQLFKNRHLQPDIVRHLSSELPSSKSFIETPYRTKSNLTEQCPALPDNVRILNLGPMARFLRELYIYLDTSNDSLLLAFKFSC